MSDKKPAKKAAVKADPAAVKEVSALVAARLEADLTADTLPHAAQSGLFQPGGGGFKRVIDAIVPALVKGAMIAADGQVSADEFRELADDAFRFIQKWLAARRGAAS